MYIKIWVWKTCICYRPLVSFAVLNFFSDEINGDITLYDYFDIVWWDVSPFEGSVWLCKPLFPRWPGLDVSKWFKSKRVQNSLWNDMWFHMVTNVKKLPYVKSWFNIQRVLFAWSCFFPHKIFEFRKKCGMYRMRK